MSYQVLARKWRPNKFAELVGQEHVVSAISNALENNRLHHAYLFSGTRGVGKTTIARIFSKSLNCEQGLGANPCGQCGTCQEIEQGNFVDLLEIDAASRTKVEDTRELLDNVQYKPTRGRYKVYLIDEVHMLSKHSFNALLKTLEEPPPHVKFLLATTDPQKLPITILSRCLQFNLKALSRAQISQQLEHIFTEESIQRDDAAIAQISRAAQGSMRDALSLSDQAVAQGNGLVSLQVVTDMLGLMDKNQVLKLLNAVLQKDSASTMEQVEKMSFQAPDYGLVLSELMSLLHQVALTQFVPEACKLETTSARAIFQLAKTTAPEQIQLLYQIALQGRKDMPFAADGRTGLEMTLLRMLAFSPEATSIPIDALLEQTPAHLGSQGTQMPPVVDDVANVVSTTNDANTIEQAPINVSSERATNEIPSSHEIDNKVTSDESSAEQPSLMEGKNFKGEQAETLNAQQNEILQQAQNLYPAEAERFNEEQAQVDYAEQQAHFNTSSPVGEAANEASHTESSSLSTTDSLLALKHKLQESQLEEEEKASQIKKSESTASEGWMPFKQNSSDDKLLTQLDPPLHSVADISSNSSDNLSSAQLAPPWETDTPEITVQARADNSLEPNLEPQSKLENEQVPAQERVARHEPLLSAEPSPKPSPAFDPNAHLDEGIDCEVDFDVPVFLENGQKVIAAQQLDSWSQLIEQMQVTALTKQLALHSSYSMQEGKVVLNLMHTKQHLNTDSARQQLQQALSQVLKQDIQLQIILDEPINTPFAVQQTINQVRQQHAHEVVNTDESITLLKDTFSAQILTESLKYR
jgi:DNA polymerase-3 subunit gamma/tau